MKPDDLRANMPWVVVALWLVVPFTTGELVDDAVASHSDALRWVEGAGAWLLWVLTLTAGLIRRPLTLTAVRLGTSAGCAAAVIASIGTDEASAWVITTGLVMPLAAFAVSMGASTGAAFIDGGSYGDERRFPLRAPVALLIAPVPLAWVVFMAGSSAGPLLLADQRWILGPVCLIVGVPAARIAAIALHGLSRRWLVFVPAGVVVHDLMTTREPFLMIGNTVASFGPAPSDAALAGEDVIDATQGASGIVLMIDLNKAVETVLRPTRKAPATVRLVNHVAIVPSRPGAVIAEAKSRRVG